MLRRALDLATVFFGFCSLIVFLAVLAAIPGLQLLSFGYLLEAEGRVARTGRFLGALPGLRVLARLGGAVLGTFLVFLPFLVLQDFFHDAVLIDPGSHQSQTLGIWLVASGVLAVVHSGFALARGGRLRHFFRPLSNVIWAARRIREGGLGGVVESAATSVRGLRLPHYFVLGLKGF